MFGLPGNRIGRKAVAFDVAPSRMKARAYRGANYTPAGGTGWKLVAIDTVDFDTHGIFNPSTSEFKPTEPGYYLVEFNCKITSANIISAAIYLNGVMNYQIGEEYSTCNTINGACLVRCNGLTDKITIQGYISGGTAVFAGPTTTFASVMGPF